MRILGIETSCDETAASIIETTENDFVLKQISNIVHSQIDIHKEFGGVVPNLAKREHEKLLPLIINKTIEDIPQDSSFSIKDFSKVESFFEKNKTLFEVFKENIETKPDIDLIGVTNGPGLEPALWVGVTASRALAVLWDVPIIGVDHMRGHICANFIDSPPPPFPCLALTISGGHTQLVLMKKPLQYELLGETVDDAAGEAFDKVARMLDMPYPGGPQISSAAQLGDKNAFDLPRPMIASNNTQFSFSGLKTAVKYLIQELGEEKTKEQKNNICASFQQAVIDVVVKKTIDAATKNNVKSVVLGGGVAANKELREQLELAIEKNTKALFTPLPIELAGDNAAMIASSGALEYIHEDKKDDPYKIEVNSNKEIDKP